MPPSRSNGRRPSQRQQPTSCDFCRRRKLRCDQQKPCSNCQSIHVECQYGHLSPPRRRSSRRRQTSGPTTAQAETPIAISSLDHNPQHYTSTSVLTSNITATPSVEASCHAQRLVAKNDLQWLRDTGSLSRRGLSLPRTCLSKKLHWFPSLSHRRCHIRVHLITTVLLYYARLILIRHSSSLTSVVNDMDWDVLLSDIGHFIN